MEKIYFLLPLQGRLSDFHAALSSLVDTNNSSVDETKTSLNALIERKIQEAIKDAKNRGYTEEDVTDKYPPALTPIHEGFLSV